MKKRIKRRRLVSVVISLSFVFVILVGRLIYLMGFEGVQYKLFALKKWTKTIDIAPKRGNVVDRNGNELAVSMNVFRVDADLRVLKDYISKNGLQEDSIVAQLSQIFGINQNDLQKTMNSKDSDGEPLQFVSLKRKVEKEAVEQIRALKLKGILISDDTKRFYPNGDFLSYIIGHTNGDGNGITGVELSYNEDLKGMQGVKVVETDGYNNDLPYSEATVIEPVDGKSIKLTIDERIQELAERVAKETLEENKAKSVSITIMDPKTGEILAMVNTPGYDLNNPNIVGKTDKEIQEQWKNRAISNVFEPGSIFKAITSAAALQNNSVTDADRFYCSGYIKVAGSTLYCDKRTPHGTETFSDIIKNSCNVGFTELSQKIGKDNFYNYAKLMGFGQKTGVDLPGESTGIIKDLNKMGPVDTATMSYGQGVAVTQVQYLAAFNAIANGGTWIRPHVMKEIYHTSEGKDVVDKEYDNYGTRTVLEKEKAAVLRTYLERVVKEGTSTLTYMEGYHIAGKTGTASEVNTATGGYVQDKYISSFAGMAPSNDPKVTLIVTIQEPSGASYYAGQTAVPAAKKLFTELFPILRIYPDETNGPTLNNTDSGKSNKTTSTSTAPSNNNSANNKTGGTNSTSTPDNNTTAAKTKR